MMTRLDMANNIESISNVTNQRAFINRKLQTALDRVYNYFDFPFYLTEGTITTVATYSTGLVTCSEGSFTVTGNGTSWTSAMVGRKMRISNNNVYYRIKSVTNTTTLVLESAYTDSSVTDSSYLIFKDEYRLASDCDKSKTFRQPQNNTVMMSTNPTRLDTAFPTPKSYSEPNIVTIVGSKLDTYTTGTISGTNASHTITGSGTTWTSVEGLGRMSVIKVNNLAYTIKSVDSDTQITTYEALSAAISTSTYEILINNIVVQVYSVPSASRILFYRYFRMPSPMVNDNDVPDMPREWTYILEWSALADILSLKGDINKAFAEYEQKFREALSQMVLKIGSFSPDMIWRKESCDKFGTSAMDATFPGNFDRRSYR